MASTSGGVAALSAFGDRPANAVTAADIVNNVKSPPFGAVGDGAADDTAAVQAAINVGAITYFPPGTYNVRNLSAVSGMQLMGAATVGSGRSRLRASAGSIFRTAPGGVYATKATSLVFDSFGGGGDLFTGLWSLGKFEDCTFIQYQDGASCFNVTGWIDMLTIRCTFDHTHTATKPTFKATSAVGELAQSSFLSTRFTKTGDYAIHLEATNGSVIENVTIRDTNFE
ncbi:glycosyl hydrolase family 28-related protein, partial [Arthrobacter sp.]|uniref:glycosyl hydrolase family 28-related protein n=1 Tax=Arthrobacter sp. TaxID=1667 RepID=UPI0033928E20